VILHAPLRFMGQHIAFFVSQPTNDRCHRRVAWRRVTFE
jgi:hypothetical protein